MAGGVGRARAARALCARSWLAMPLGGSRGAETRGPVRGRGCGCSVYTSKVARQQQSIATWDLLSDGALRYIGWFCKGGAGLTLSRAGAFVEA